MDWRILGATFGTIFLAELGDKTQLATLMLAAQSKSPWTVFLGSALALVLVSLIGVLAAQALVQFLPFQLVKRGAGIGFMLLGLLLFLDVI
ncbi:MAG: TMEM165/GDT1 family protein [Desulfohalobiaceae bacterium]|nr:TMEM165/GDT1 family protein [Desulfohalobiaceae bacterium]